MKKYNIAIIILLITSSIKAQVNGAMGINTTTPKATFDVQAGTIAPGHPEGIIAPRLTGAVIKSKDADYGSAQIGAIVYATSASPDAGLAGTKTIHMNGAGYYYFDGSVWQVFMSVASAPGLNTTVYSAAKTGSWDFISLSILASGTWNQIDLTGTSDTKIGNASLFTNGVYTAPSSGTYIVKYEFRPQASGVDLNLLASQKIGLIKTTGGTNTLLDSKAFDGVTVVIPAGAITPGLNLGLVSLPALPATGITLASVPVTSSTLNSMVQLNAGDNLSFVVSNGGIGVNALKNGTITLYVYKISD
ncbi:hypothetical protein [Fluviicola sp.]|jgi:hypothetical protein|uniref:hypothetical protein n=1 Tax=Fluviicola sp. TaxID=1917219 RepID=UPI002837B919|nr:hypothetical protein [Fluviicola sp.]MDR0803260.1 hypothetical protein [Fluviicola sp.]